MNTAQRTIRSGSLQAWVLALRPATLSVGLVPVLVGTAVARTLDAVRLMPALMALLGAILIQIGTNLANDVFDHEKGADTPERLGPLRVTQAGLLSPAQVRRGMALSFALATLAGLYLVWVAGPLIILVGVAAIASGIAYTGGHYPLGYRGLGDVFVFVFFGLVAVCGTVFVQAGRIPALALWVSLPVGAIATAVLVVNNIRDLHTDVKANKRTLVVRLGRRFGVLEYAFLIGLSYLVPGGLVCAGVVGRGVLLPLLSLPLALPLCLAVARSHDGAVLNRTLARTARLLLVHGALLALGLVL